MTSSLIPNFALRRLRQGGLAMGFGVYQLRTAAVAMIARQCGYQWLSIDAEHGSFSIAEIGELCAGALAAGISPIVRANQDDLALATRALDAGAQGIIIPNVETAEQAAVLVDRMRYGPMGRRGLGGGGARFAFTPPAPAAAMRELNDETLIIAMIETETGVANAADIAAIAGIDMLFVGLNDLSIALGVPGEFDSPALQSAFGSVASTAKAHGKYLGMGGVYQEQLLPAFLSHDVHFVVGCNDQSLIIEGARARAHFIDAIYSKTKMSAIA